MIITIEPFTVSLPLLEISAVPLPLTFTPLDALISAFSAFDLEVGLRLERHGLLAARQRDAVLVVSTIELPFWSSSTMPPSSSLSVRRLPPGVSRMATFFLSSNRNAILLRETYPFSSLSAVGSIGGALALL